MRYIKEKSLTPLQQLYGLKNFFPNGNGGVKKNRLRWECMVQPTPLSREYLVRIIYKFGSQPSVFVLKPSLKILSEGIPLTSL